MAQELITYKSINFGATESEFIQRFSEDSYICKNADSGVGRQCESTSSTYANISPVKTIAFFVKDQFVGVSIYFESPKNTATNASIESELRSTLENVLLGEKLLSALKQKYGSKSKEEAINKKTNTVTKKKWIDKQGNELIYLNSIGSIGWFYSVHITSKAGNELFKTESDKRQKEIIKKNTSDL